MRRFFILLFIIGVFKSFDINGLNQFKRLGVENGLSNSTVECIFQDHLGYIWIGTDNGLNRYDGYNFTYYYYEKNDSNSLRNNEIMSIYEDRQLNLWVGTSNGLHLFNRETNNFTFISFPDGFYTVRFITEDKKGNLWVGTYGGGLYRYISSKKELEKSTYPEFQYCSINDICEDRYGNLWISTENKGLFQIDRNSSKLKPILEHIFQPLKGKYIKIKSTCEDNNGNIWISAYTYGIIIYDPVSQKIITNNFNLPQMQKASMQIIKDSNHKIWITYDGFGLVRFDPNTNTYTKFTNSEIDKFSLSNNAPRALYEDHNKNLWIGSYNGGISITQLSADTHFNIIRNEPGNLNSLPNNNVTGITSDNSYNLWITTDGGGLCKLNISKGILNLINPPATEGLQYKNALCVINDNAGNIWAGYYQGGYISIDSKGKIKQYFDVGNNESQTGIKNDIRSILQDKKGNIWIGTNGQGVQLIDKESGETKIYAKDYAYGKPGIAFNFIRCIFEDSKGYVWIGTTFGLTRFNVFKNEFLNIYENRSDRESILSNSVFQIIETTDGNMCFATSEGLSILNTPVWSKEYDKFKSEKEFKFTNYTVANGLPDHSVNSLIEDNQHNLWLGTGKGLSMFDSKKRIFKNYSIEESFNEVFNIGAVYKAYNGKIYFGTIKGLVSFFPDSITEPIDKQKVVITDIKINFESIAGLEKYSDWKNITLSSSEKAINFEFSALEMYYPNEIKYQYKLEGFDKEWITTDASHRYATYTNLDPGDYKFLIKSTNKNGIWSDNPTEINITVLPPFYRSIWFLSLLVLFISGGLYIIYKLRIKTIENRNRKLEKLVKERTSELVSEREKQKQQELEKKEMVLKQKELEAENLKAEKELIQLKNVNLQYEIEKQKSEVEKKNSELTSLAAQMAQKIEFMAKLKNSLAELSEKSNSEGQLMLTAIIKQIEKDNDIRKEWEQFEQHFNQTNNNFFVVLKERFPDLTPHDIRMCGYLRMNLSNKEIAALQNISLRGVEKGRFRLRKKMKLENDENIITFLMGLTSENK